MDENDYRRDDFIGRWADNALSDDEKNEFELWLKNNPDEQSFFDELLKLHQSSKFVSVPAAPTERLWKTINQTMASKAATRTKIQYIVQWVAAIAACILIYFGVESQFAYKEFITAKAQQTEIVLPDGSVAKLNGLSSIRYNAWRWFLSRDVVMRGEVYFEVQKNKQPFTVSAENLIVEVLGTRFNVRDRDDRTEVFCSSGKVSVSARDNHEKIILTPGLAVNLHRGHFSNLYPMDTSLIAGWSQGVWNYQSAPIYSILNDWEITYGITVSMDSIDAHRTFTGLIYGESGFSALKQLGLSAGFEPTLVDDSTFYLRTKKQSFIAP